MTRDPDWAGLSALEKDWNTYGSDQPSQEALAAARGAYLGCVVKPRVVPCVEGGVSLVWMHEDRYADIEFFNEGVIVAITYNRATGRHKVWYVLGIGWTLSDLQYFMKTGRYR